MVEDLDSKMRDLSDLDRVSLINELILMNAGYQHQYRVGRRAQLGTIERYRGDEAQAHSQRLERIIYFLRFRIPAEYATAEDMKLCKELAEKLQAKGQWTESIHSEAG
jgi:hypothetical protein